jgi:hypothetical protein
MTATTGYALASFVWFASLSACSPELDSTRGVSDSHTIAGAMSPAPQIGGGIRPAPQGTRLLGRAELAQAGVPTDGSSATDASPPPIEPSRRRAAEPPARSDPTLARTFGWVTIAIGSEASLIATVTGIMMLEDRSTRNQDCSAQKVCSSLGYNANSDIASTEVWNTGAFIVAAAGLSIGTLLLLTHPIVPHAQFAVGPTSVRLGGSF